MPKVTYIGADGAVHETIIAVGVSAMTGAVDHNVPGIDGDCGGATACGTCHVYVDEAWVDRIGPAASDMERSMLEFVEGAQDNSRLCCQIALSPDLDGLVLRVPEGQH